jgi:predicted unusual protein kinase regulating ubiquinone biosynthesis (AarF/ABC1/UbiB family)
VVREPPPLAVLRRTREAPWRGVCEGHDIVTADRSKTLIQWAATSDWVAADPRLLDALAELYVEAGARQDRLGDRAIELAQPGPVDPLRLVRHAAAASVSRAFRLATTLPGAVTSGRPLADPQGFLRDAAVEAFVDQLALGGPAAAEIARQIQGGGALFPSVLRRELAKRDIRAVPVPGDVADPVLARSLTDPRGEAVHLVDRRPLTGTPVSQLHVSETEGGEWVSARVRRPRIARDLDSDSRLAAGAAAALTRIAPDVGGMGPLGFVQLVMRMNLEATDLRYEALNLVALGLVVEDLEIDGLVVARPRPWLVGRGAVVTEHLEGTPLPHHFGAVPDPAGALRALMAICVEAALVHGLFWGDPAPEHLLVLPDGRLALVGVGVLGRFTPELRLAGVRTLKAVLTGDFEGMIEGMRVAGALRPDTDVNGLITDLSNSPDLDPTKVLFGGESALLDALSNVVRIMLTHRMQAPVEVTLLLRTFFALGRMAGVLDPDGGTGLTAALLPMLPRLPQLIADAEAAAPS